MYIRSGLQSSRLMTLDSNTNTWQLVNSYDTKFNSSKLKTENVVALSTKVKDSGFLAIKDQIRISHGNVNVEESKFSMKKSESIDWSLVEDTFNQETSTGYIQNSSGSLLAVEALEGVEFIDKMIVNRNQFQQVINQNKSTDGREVDTVKLNELFNATMEKRVDAVVTQFEDFFSDTESRIDKDALKDNLMTIVEQRKDAFMEILHQIKKDENEPSEDVLYEKLSSVRSVAASSPMSRELEKLTFEEMIDMGKAIKEFVVTAHSHVVKSDETLGINLGFAKLKTVLVVNSTSFSDSIVKDFQDAVNMKIKSRISECISERDQEYEKIFQSVVFRPPLREINEARILDIVKCISETSTDSMVHFKEKTGKILSNAKHSFVNSDLKYADLDGYIDPRRTMAQRSSVLDKARAQRCKSFESSISRSVNSWNSFLGRVKINEKEEMRMGTLKTEVIDVLV